MRLLVTGGGGFVAGHFLNLAAKKWAGEILTTRFNSAGTTPAGIASAPLDIRDREAVLEIVHAFRPTHILHLAAISAPGQAQQNPADAWRANVLGALHIAEAAVICGAQQLIFASSAEVYGRAFLAYPIADERVEPEPASVYGRIKYAAEQAVADVLAGSSCAGVAVRAANHSGPGQDERFVTPAFAAQVARIEVGEIPPVVATGDLTARRDFLDVRDVARGYLAILTAPSHPGMTVLNLGSGVARPVAEIIDVLKSSSRVPFDVVLDPDRLRPQIIESAALDATRIAEVYGWRPEIAFETMVRDVLIDYRTRVG
ncbi:NAD-dependent epimerase/dehydratase family protein [Brevundimonas sp. TWP2-3-4b1]|uniref:NAD-dependent epimerase/dehydratase family protein n=1 Tax=Brevundimonas sp. TWP2-3-4b1 TaxID=2804580 RepID=UPI003CE86D54